MQRITSLRILSRNSADWAEAWDVRHSQKKGMTKSWKPSKKPWIWDSVRPKKSPAKPDSGNGESKPGKGSTFNVYIPRIEKEVTPKTEATEVLPGGSERILFVDDEQVLVNIGKEMLERLGYEVTARTSSIEALELFRVKPDQFDLVITDMTMPNMTGEKLAKEIMGIRADIPIILCTGYSEHIGRESAEKILDRMRPYLEAIT